MTDRDCHDWKHLAEAARDEKDPERLLDLVQQLTRALDKRKKNLYPRSTETTG